MFHSGISTQAGLTPTEAGLPRPEDLTPEIEAGELQEPLPGKHEAEMTPPLPHPAAWTGRRGNHGQAETMSTLP